MLIECQNNFYEILTICSAENVPKIKNAQNLSKSSTSNISSMPISILMSKIISKKYLLLVRPKLVPRLKMLRFIKIWQIWYFEYPVLDYIKDYFYQTFTTCSAQISLESKSTQNLLKFSTFHISNNPISILMSKIIFIKYLPLVRSQVVLKLKVLRI